jgi:hypothetical protein
LPAQSFLVLGPIGTHGHIFVDSETTYVLWSGTCSLTRGGGLLILSATSNSSVMSGKFLLSLASTATLGFRPHGTHDWYFSVLSSCESAALAPHSLFVSWLRKLLLTPTILKIATGLWQHNLLDPAGLKKN